MKKHLFNSERLGFREWKDGDIDELFRMNSNVKVMQYFPKTLTKEECASFISRMQNQFLEQQFCYFPVEIIATHKFIGFIGLSLQTFSSNFNPSVDIGWRLHPDYWGKGYAKEGAQRCMDYAFTTLHLKEVLSVAPLINKPSIALMQKIGMVKKEEFKHPLLKNHPKLEDCVLFQKSNTF